MWAWDGALARCEGSAYTRGHRLAHELTGKGPNTHVSGQDVAPKPLSFRHPQPLAHEDGT